MRKRNIPIALSSDAHAPEEIGASYDELIELARSEGYEEVATFSRRVRTMAKIG